MNNKKKYIDRMVENRTVPIDTRDPTKGLITFYPNTPTEPKGVFAFSYYNRSKQKIFTNKNIVSGASKDPFSYLKGMTTYLQLTELEGPFIGWKVVVYTDEMTRFIIDDQKNDAMIAFKQHPNLILAVCTWPEYELDPLINDKKIYKKIENVLLRTLRFHAFLDFYTVPVCIRDADTHFENLMLRIPVLLSKKNVSGPRPLKTFIQYLFDWEVALIEHHKSSGFLFLLTAHPGYMQDWHANTKLRMYTMGHMAGIVNCLPGLSEWNPENSSNLWNLSLEWLRERYSIKLAYGKHKVISNLDSITYIGKDEQIISFVWLEHLITKCFFFYYHIQDTEHLDLMKRAREARDKGVPFYFDMFMKYKGGFLEENPNRLWTPHMKLLKFQECSGEIECKKVFDSLMSEHYFPEETIFDINIFPYIQDPFLFNHLNVFNVIEAFRDPVYIDFLRFVLNKFLSMYLSKREAFQALTAVKASISLGGKRRARRTVRKGSRKSKRKTRKY